MVFAARIKSIARAGGRWLKASALSAYGRSSVLRSYVPPRPRIRERWVGSVDLGTANRVAVFSHFDPRGFVRDFVHYYLQQLRDAGYTIVFVTHAPRLQPVSVERLMRECAIILRQDNAGWDFSAYRAGIETLPNLSALESLLLVNDSVYGPFYELGALIDRMNLAEGDVWGITDSWERRFHLQSFFILFSKSVLTSAVFESFWRAVRPVKSKSWVISRYEIGLTQAMMAAGFRCRALFPYRVAAMALELKALGSLTLKRNERRFLRHLLEITDAGIPMNPTHFFWQILISHGCPFLKRELLRDNPARIPGLPRWEEVVKSVSDYDTDLIVRDLEMSMHRRIV
jgi:lipopolysaccharide biosynthesis protein